MFSSLKGKIIFFITLIMGITVIAIVTFTHQDVGKAMREAERASALNVLNLVKLNIQGGYNKLLSDKFDMIIGLNQQLKSIGTICVSGFEQYDLLVEKQMIDREEAKRNSLNWIRSIKFGKGRVFVFDRNARIIAHPDTRLEGQSIALLEDMKGRRIAEAMNVHTPNFMGESAVFFWRDTSKGERGKKLGYFIPFRKWHWTICAIIDFDSIEAQSEKKMQNIIKVLKKTFDNIQIGKTGYPFLFNGKGEILIPPADRKNADYSIMRNKRTGNLLLKDLVNAFKERKELIRYIEDTSRGEKEIEAHVAYFKAFDWYIVTTVPVLEIQEPAKALVTRQSVIIILIFIGSLILAYIFVTRTSRPLRMLASYAKDIPSIDFTAEKDEHSPIDELPGKFKDEVGRLAQAFVSMRTELRNNIQKLISATNNAAKERLERETAEAASRTKNEFLANMSHEIRTPMNAIIGFSDLLARMNLGKKQKKYINIIRSSSRSLLGIINDILDVSKIEAGKLKFEDLPMSFQEIIDQIYDLFREKIEQGEVEFVVDIDPDVPRQVVSDPLRIRQVLVNLISNAFKFTEQGKITLSIQTREISDNTAELLFCVRDTRENRKTYTLRSRPTVDTYPSIRLRTTWPSATSMRESTCLFMISTRGRLSL